MNYQQRSRLESDLENQIGELSRLTRQINSHLKSQEKVRSGLGDYLDKGKEALVRINASLADLGSRFSFFGCNGVVLLGIALLVICVLALF